MARFLFLLAIFCSTISQMPTILDSGLSGMLNAAWLLPLTYMIITSPRSFFNNRLLPFYIFVLSFTYYAFICQSLTGNKYFTEDLYNFYVSLLVTTISFAYWQRYGEDHILQSISLVFIAAVIPVALEIFFKYLLTTDIMSRTYAYSEKNSAAHMMLNASLIGMMILKSSSSKAKVIKMCSIAFMLLIMIMLRSRATFVSAFYLLAFFIMSSGNKKFKYAFIVLTIIIVVVLILNADINDIIVQGLIFGGRESTDINELSSNRFILMLIALPNIPKHPWIGVGDYYIDCMPFDIQLQYGIIGVIIVFSFLFYVFYALNKGKRSSLTNTTTYLLFMSLMVNSLFEARPPFGPGSKATIMWIFFGIFLALTYNSQKVKSDTTA